GSRPQREAVRLGVTPDRHQFAPLTPLSSLAEAIRDAGGVKAGTTALSAVGCARADANRLTHIASRPREALHFDGNGQGGNIVVLAGRASLAVDVPPPHEHAAYLAKYRDAMTRVSGSLETFSANYPVALAVQVERVRGF
ncbi:MAG TPA: hypothetical protein VIM17_12730, partial [Jatrophihabitantaceae bacterium]